MKLASLIVLLVVISLALTFSSDRVTARDIPPPNETTLADVGLIAAWLRGNNSGKAFKEAFDDHEAIAAAKAAVFFTDAGRVKLPPSMKQVTYDFLSARMATIKGGGKGDPGIIVAKATVEDPQEGLFLQRDASVRKGNGDERYYFVEVAVGNLAWHYKKLAVYEIDGDTRVDVLWSIRS